MKSRLLALLTIGVCALPMAAIAADERSYTEGTVTEVTSVRTKPGMFDAYMSYLAGTYKQLMEEEKKAGIILSYAVVSATPRRPEDPDLYLITEYKNLAAMDGLEDRVEPIQRKVWASRDQANKATADRESLREILGSELVRELKLK